MQSVKLSQATAYFFVDTGRIVVYKACVSSSSRLPKMAWIYCSVEGQVLIIHGMVLVGPWLND